MAILTILTVFVLCFGIGPRMFKKKNQDADGESQQDKWGSDKYSHSRAIVTTSLAPAAVLFALAGLTESWYIQGPSIPGETPFAHLDNPPLSIIGESFGLALNLLASLSVILRILDRSPLYTTLCAVTCLSLAILLDILTLTLFARSHPNHAPNGYTLSPAYWLTAASAIMSFLCLVTLTADLIKTKCFRVKMVVLTPKQRALAISFATFLLYLAVGSIMFKFLMKLSFLDSLYFMLQTILTVGYGDLVPNTPAGQAILIFYIPPGIIILAIIISLIRETVLQSIKDRLVKKVEDETSKRWNWQKLMKIKRGPRNPPAEEEKESERRLEELSYEEMLRESLNKQGSEESHLDITLAAVAFICFWLLGSMAYTFFEGWSYGVSMYFCFVTFTTIGYGEFTPTTSGGRAFFIGWGIFGVSILTVLLTLLAEAWTTHFKYAMRRHFFRRFQKKADSQDTVRKDSTDIERQPISAPVSSTPSRSDSNASNLAQNETRIKQDVHALEKDVEDSSSSSQAKSKRVERDIVKLLTDCQMHVRALLNSDGDKLRKHLDEVFEVMESRRGKKRDGEKLDGRTRRRLVDDDDNTVSMLLLKHCDYQLEEIIESTRKEQEQSGNRPDDIPTNRRSSGSHT